jgi:hypothetical protein
MNVNLCLQTIENYADCCWHWPCCFSASCFWNDVANISVTLDQKIFEFWEIFDGNWSFYSINHIECFGGVSINFLVSSWIKSFFEPNFVHSKIVFPTHCYLQPSIAGSSIPPENFHFNLQDYLLSNDKKIPFSFYQILFSPSEKHKTSKAAFSLQLFHK